MGSMMADLKDVHTGINAQLKAQGKELTTDEVLVMLFDEVQYVYLN